MNVDVFCLYQEVKIVYEEFVVEWSYVFFNYGFNVVKIFVLDLVFVNFNFQKVVIEVFCCVGYIVCVICYGFNGVGF